MKGARSLSDDELKKIGAYFDIFIGDPDIDRYDLLTRDKTLIFFTIYTGFRINEVLSLKIADVMGHGKTISSYVYLQKQNTKGKRAGRTGVINSNCKKILEDYFSHYRLWDLENKQKGLFLSKKGDLMNRQALNIFKTTFAACCLDGKLSTHTARKTFSRLVYKNLNEDILGLKSALGHSNISSTMSYIEENKEKVSKVLEELKL